jgi:hypothetical protein
MFNPPLVFKTYQDVKNNLVYWTFVVLLLSTAVIYLLILNPIQKQAVASFVASLGTNGFVAALAGSLLISIYGIIAIGLIYGIQIHDIVYDRIIIKWRERFDTEFILTKLTEPIKQDLPKNFLDYAIHYRYQFMKPYYYFVGDGKKGIEENTRIRFYERVTWYWITQLNEIFILLFLIGTPIYVLAYSSGSLTTSSFAIFVLSLTTLGLVNRWFIRLTLNATAQATLDEIEEILAKPKNIQYLKESYTQLCNSYKI